MDALDAAKASRAPTRRQWVLIPIGLRAVESCTSVGTLRAARSGMATARFRRTTGSRCGGPAVAAAPDEPVLAAVRRVCRACWRSPSPCSCCPGHGVGADRAHARWRCCSPASRSRWSIYFALLRRALAPLERLTAADAPGRSAGSRPADRDRAGDEQVVALAEAFNEMLDRLESERRDSALRALARAGGRAPADRARAARRDRADADRAACCAARRSPAARRRSLRGDLEELREAARRGAEDVRTIARRLRPEALDELGLQSALLALCTSLASSRRRGRARRSSATSR